MRRRDFLSALIIIRMRPPDKGLGFGEQFIIIGQQFNKLIFGCFLGNYWNLFESCCCRSETDQAETGEIGWHTIKHINQFGTYTNKVEEGNDLEVNDASDSRRDEICSKCPLSTKPRCGSRQWPPPGWLLKMIECVTTITIRPVGCLVVRFWKHLTSSEGNMNSKPSKRVSLQGFAQPTTARSWIKRDKDLFVTPFKLRQCGRMPWDECVTVRGIRSDSDFGGMPGWRNSIRQYLHECCARHKFSVARLQSILSASAAAACLLFMVKHSSLRECGIECYLNTYRIKFWISVASSIRPFFYQDGNHICLQETKKFWRITSLRWRIHRSMSHRPSCRAAVGKTFPTLEFFRSGE